MLGIFKGVGIALGIVFGLLGLIGAVFYITGKAKVMELHEVTPPLMTVAADSAAVARGAHLTNILSCRVCHGERLEGKEFLDIPPFRVTASNLTAGDGGIASDYTDADWDRALRYGIKPNGRAMLVMPSNLFHPLSDTDAAAMIAYLKQVSPVDNILLETEARFPLFLMAGAPGPNIFPNVLEEDDPREPVPPEAATSEYGAYLARLACVECHGVDLNGGPAVDPNAPDGPSLIAAGQWPLEAFSKAMREGQTPTGQTLQDEYMPWNQSYKHLSDVDVEALHLYLNVLQQDGQ